MKNRFLYNSTRNGLLSLLVSSSLYAQSSLITAYDVPSGVVGAEPNQINLLIALNFDVQTPVQIVSIGAFDSGSDGLFGSSIQVALFDRQSGIMISPQLEFSSDSNGFGIGGSRFKALIEPINLPAGFQGAIVAGAYAAGEKNGNGAHQSQVWTSNGANGALSFQTSSYDINYNNTGLFLPTAFLATGYTTDVFAAGTFQYAVIPEPAASARTVGVVALIGLALCKRRKKL